MAWDINYITHEDNVARRAMVSLGDSNEEYDNAGYYPVQEDSQYPASNMLSLPVSKPARIHNRVGQTSGIMKIHVVFSAATSINCIALVAHNITSGATISVYGGSSFDPTSSLGSITWRKKTAFIKFSAAQNYQYFTIRITDAANPDGFVSVGYLMMGTLSQLGVGYHDYTYEDSYTSLGGRGASNTRTSLSAGGSVRFEFRNRTKAEMDSVRAFFESVQGPANPLLVIRDSGSSDCAFGHFEADTFRETYRSKYEISAQFTLSEDQLPIVSVSDMPLLVAGQALSSEWTYDRQSGGYYKGADLKLYLAASGVFRNLNYYDYGKCGFLLEGQNTNLIEESNALDTWWSVSAEFTVTELTASGIFSTGESAWQLVNDGTLTSRSITKLTGTNYASGTWYCLSAIIENINALVFDVGLYNQTDGGWVAKATYTWSTGTITASSGSAVTAGDYHFYIENYGPNRIRLAVAAEAQAADDGDAIRLYIYPTGTTQNSNAAIYHHAQYETPMWMPSSPIVTSGASATRYADQLYKSWDMEGEPLTVYMRFVELGGKNHYTGADLYYLAVGQTGSNSNPRIVLYNYGTVTTLGRGPYRMYNGTASTASAQHVSETQMANVSVGDVVEVLGTINPASDCDLEMTVSGATYVGTTTTDSQPGFNPNAYERIAINGDTTLAAGKEKPNLFQCIKILRGDQSLATMRSLR